MPAVIAAPPGAPLPEGTQEKQEFTALLSRLIVEQWKIVQKLRAEHQDCCGLMIRDVFGVGNFLPLDDESLKTHLSPNQTVAPQVYATSLAAFMTASFTQACENMCEAPIEIRPPELIRLSTLLRNAVGSSGATDPQRLISVSGSTAVTATWWCLGALPPLFRELGVERPNIEELRAATQGIFQFLQRLSTHHFHVFVGLVSLCREVTPGGQKLDSFNPDTLVLAARPQGTDVSNFGLLEFGVSEQVARRVIAHLQSKADGKQLPTTGCPALFAMGQESTVIPELFAWVLEVAEKFYFPHVIRHSEQEQRMT